MKYRNLRIAWSVAWSTLAVLLVFSWMRSYWWHDSLWHPERGLLPNGFSSVQGDLHVHWDSEPGAPEWRLWSGLVKPEENRERFWIENRFIWRGGPCAFLCFPYWSAAVVPISLTALPWIRLSKRFSLRTLLIATTLVAVGLGIIAWLA